MERTIARSPASSRRRDVRAIVFVLGVLSLSAPARAQPAADGSVEAPVLLYTEAPAPSMIHRTEPHTPLWVSGLHISVMAHAFGVVWASAYRPSGGTAESTVMAIPLVGGFAWAGLSHESWTLLPLVVGVPTSIVQIAGFVLMIAGAIIRRRVPDDRLEGARVELGTDGLRVSW